MNFDLITRFVARFVAAASLLVALAAPLMPAFAATDADNGERALRGLKLRHWSLEEGAPSRINAIAQSADGFLWIGGVEGLTRFDGRTFERVGPSPNSPDRMVVARLLAARDGTLWIGLARSRGVMIWREGRLRDAAMPHPSREVNDLAQGPDGAIWVTRGGRGTRSLARWAAGRWTEFDQSSGLPQEPAWNPLFARDGTMWLTTESGVYRKRPQAQRFEPTGIATVPRATLAQAPDGTIWLTERSRTRLIARDDVLVRGGTAVATPFAIRTLFDRHGDFWGATWSNGMVRVEHLGGQRQSPVLGLDTRGGLLSNPVRALFEDREGNIWIGGEMGLNMLRRVPIVAAPGIAANASANHMLAATRDGTVFIADDHDLFRIAVGQNPKRIAHGASLIEAICAANDGGLWIIERGRAILMRRDGQSRSHTLPNSVAPNSCGEDRAGRLWLPALQKGLWVLHNGQAHVVNGSTGSAALPGNVAILADGRAAVHFRGNPPAQADAEFIALSDRQMPRGVVEGILPVDDTVLLSGSAGLAAPLLPRKPLLDSASYPWAGSINGLAQSAAGVVWTIGDTGLVSMPLAQLKHALANPGAPVAHRLFDFRDGLASFAQKSSGAQIVAGGDGRIWFATRGNISSIDPRTISRNTLPPDVVVLRIRTGPDQRFAAGATLPVGTSRVEIDYTATSLAVPERVRFRYRLVGGTGAWLESSLRTAAFANLGPGAYRFEVVAANEDGIWSTAPATAEFHIERAFHQTWWFRVGAVLAVVAVLYGLYEMRLRQVAGRIRTSMMARTAERERIARELHDTMIQGVQGLVLRFQAVADRYAEDPAAQAVLLPALDRAEEMLVEGRERVTGLRRTRVRDFHKELARLMENEIYPQDLIAPLIVQRPPRPIAPGIIDDILAVVGEALNNAACHAQSSRIEVGVRYGRWEFDAFVRDNGVGMEAETLASGSPKGHFGILGMRERMVSIGGKLRVESAKGFGTEIRLTLPAKLAYSANRDA